MRNNGPLDNSSLSAGTSGMPFAGPAPWYHGAADGRRIGPQYRQLSACRS